MAQRTCILITHHVRLCAGAAKHLVKLDNGRVVIHGKIEDVLKSEFLIDVVGNDGSDFVQDDHDAIEYETEDSRASDAIEDEVDTQPEANSTVNDPIHTVFQSEARQRGSVKATIYKMYIQASGGAMRWGLIFSLFLLIHGLAVAKSFWLKGWAQAYAFEDTNNAYFVYMGTKTSENANMNTWLSAPNSALTFHRNLGRGSFTIGTSNPVNFHYYLGIYLLMDVGTLLVELARLVVQYYSSLNASRLLYKRLLGCVLRAPIRFFDTTPVGRIMNRFAKDFEVIDTSIAIRQLKRLDSITRSPIYSHFDETIMGLTTIRAFSAERRFMDGNLKMIDNNNRSFWFLWGGNRCLSMRTDGIGASITLVTGVLLLYRLSIGNIDAGLGGLSLSCALQFVSQVNWLVRNYTQIEMDLNSVERIQEFLQLEQEPPAIIANSRPSAAWPTEGRVSINNLHIQYAPELEALLRGVTIETKPKEKIGVVGRTGSGKSTLAMSLFRFVDPVEGSIVIDGVDITTIGTEDLRSRLTIIPQDPVLFSGSIRSNLDPQNLHDDSAILESLERVHLVKNTGDSIPAIIDVSSSITAPSAETNVNVFTNLDSLVNEGGNDFSQGQRQLLCLTKALLRNSKIIVIDEATASVDFATDHKIQTTIQAEFNNSTLLTIAHRLRTILQYDRVLVLDHGQVLEFDTPYNLLRLSDGVFRGMCETSGEIEILLDMAKQKQDADAI
ncbi:Transporter of the ATP-binding cassette (ABC) [Umbelopsis nana]